MNDKCFFYKEDERGPFTKPWIPIGGLFSKSDLDSNVEDLSTIKIGKKSFPINLQTEKGRIRKKVSRWGQNMSKTLF